MPRSLGRKPIAIDQRTGRKIRYADLVEDGENPNIRVAREEADPEHPQKYVRTPGPDQVVLYNPSPDIKRDNTLLRVGWGANSANLWEGTARQPVTACGSAENAAITYLAPSGFGDGGFGEGGFGGTETDETTTRYC